MKRILLLALLGFVALGAEAQRVTDKLDRGIVAVPMNNGGYLVTWRKFGTEYYDTQYNLYRNGTKIASNLTVTNYKVSGASSSDTYQVEAVVKGVAQEKSPAVKAWKEQYFEVKVQDVVNRAGVKQTNAVTNGTSNSPAGYTLNDVSLADVDGDGISEFIVKRNNDKGNRMATDNTTDFNLYECYKMDGTRLWWIDLGPNLMAGPDEQWDMIGYDWDCDGKAEMIMRGADNMIIHTSKGATINIGNMNYYAPRDEYTHQGAEYLLYLNGETGEPYGWDGTSTNYTPDAYPLPRFEVGESDYATVWGAGDTGHRSAKHYFGAPYLDGRKPSIFLGRGCYTRHKFCALDVDPATHQLTQRWRWNCYDSKSAWYGNGFHNFAIADVDWDGRDEIVFGSMIIDDTGYGLSTTGYGHGDAQHCGDLDPYRWGQEQFVCLEGSTVPGLAYTNATTSDVYIQTGTGGDNGRCLAGNFTNDIPAGEGRAVGGSVYALAADKYYSTSADDYMAWGDLNMRIYWDGDLLDEIMNSPGVQRAVKITKWGNGRLNFYNSSGQYSPVGILNNSSKNNPSALGDILGDWREELVLRGSSNDALYVVTTNYETEHGLYTLWHDHQYRNAMAWQCMGYNQPPHVSFFLGELEGITMAPPPLMLDGRTELQNGASIATTNDHLLVSGYENKTISVQDGASPYILTVNAPAWLKGSGSQQATSGTPKLPTQTVETFTTTLTGGAFSGTTRLVKQGEGVLVLPNVIEKYTGNTDVWNGTLQFDGTMQSSPVWLNRHTTLISNGGKFMAGLKADYNATIYPGGKEQVGSITASTLQLGFGSRVVFDMKDAQYDQLNATTLDIEAKTSEEWLNFGPKYKAPVMAFVYDGELAVGSYEIGTVGTLTGSDLKEIVLEGFPNNRKASLKHEDGKLILVIEEMRVADTAIWNGTSTENIWQQAVTQNFLNNGTATYSADGDDIIFNDDAATTEVTIKGAVSPNSITFNNETKNYTLSGDSIVGKAPITKNGAGRLTIKNTNHSGETFINGGTVVVAQLANNAGQDYGSLGDASQVINLGDGATLSTDGVIITDQTLKVSGETTINVPTGKSVIFNKAIKGAGATINKTGAGSMETGTLTSSYNKLVIKAGTMTSNYSSSHAEQLPKYVEFQGGTLWAANDEGTNVNCTANFSVPANKTGVMYAGFRSTYTGKLTGAGSFTVYTGGVRCYFDGDWSEFEGTVIANKNNRQNKKSYDPVWMFRNTNGLPNATLNVAEDVRVSNEGKNIVVKKLAGKGTLTGSGQWIVNSDENFTLTTEVGVTSERTDPYGGTIAKSTSPLTKRGSGKMTMTAGNMYGALTVEGGTVVFNDTKLTTLVHGSATTTIKGEGRIVGQGLLNAVSLQAGGELMPCGSTFAETIPGTIKCNNTINVNSGSTITFMKNASKNSTLDTKNLTLNGTVKVVLLSGYTPKAGDTMTLWTVSGTLSGTPSFLLPDLPDGLYWDASGLSEKTGVLRITDDASQSGIGRMAADTEVLAEVYNMSGTRVATFRTTKGEASAKVRQAGLRMGTYIVKMQADKRTEVTKVVVR